MAKALISIDYKDRGRLFMIITKVKLDSIQSQIKINR